MSREDAPLSHRPVGSGADTVRLTPRTDQGGARLFLGRALWQRIGSPARVALRTDRRREVLNIRPGGDHAVAGAATDGMPRVALSLRACVALSLDPERETTYGAAATGRTIAVFLTLPPHGQFSGPDFRALRDRLGLTQQALAGALDLHVSTIRDWERGGTHLTLARARALEALASQRDDPADRP